MAKGGGNIIQAPKVPTPAALPATPQVAPLPENIAPEGQMWSDVPTDIPSIDDYLKNNSSLIDAAIRANTVSLAPPGKKHGYWADKNAVRYTGPGSQFTQAAVGGGSGYVSNAKVRAAVAAYQVSQLPKTKRQLIADPSYIPNPPVPVADVQESEAMRMRNIRRLYSSATDKSVLTDGLQSPSPVKKLLGG